MPLYRRFTRARRWMDDHPMAGGSAAIAIFLVAFLIRYALDSELPPGFPYLTFFPAIVIATFLFGTPAGILCAGLSFVAAWYFFLPPFMSFSLSGQTALALGFFVLIVAVDIFVIDRMLGALDDLARSRRQALDLARQRDALFKELQHRVGNNLNMIAAMLSIQSRALGEGPGRHALTEASRRIQLVADINRMFHDPAHADGVLDDAFVRELGSKCLDAAGMAGKVSLSLDIDAMAFGQDEFLPISLILAECINNALEHGIADNAQGMLRVTLRQNGEEAELVVENDGKPLEKAIDPARARSIGLMLVHSFALQVEGVFAIEGGARTRSILRFPVSMAASPASEADTQLPGALPSPA